jgi:gas vesicle protein/sporulation protein YlmC with PRC-barrel domain
MALQDAHGATPAGGGDVVPLRIERGAEVFATDGALGTVEQVVMNQDTRELQAIVVRPQGLAQEMVIGIGHVTRAGENQVHLDFGRAEMDANPTLAQPYHPDQYVPVPPTAAVPPGQAAQIAMHGDQPVVTGLAHDAVEVIAPVDQIRPAQTQHAQATADWHTPGGIASVAPQQMERPEIAAAMQSAIPAMPATPGAPVDRSRTQASRERTAMKNLSDRSPKTPQMSKQKARAGSGTGGATYRDETTIPMQYPGGLPGWVPPVVLGVGTAALATGVAVGAISWRRRSQPTGLDWWRAQFRQMARNPQKTSRRMIKSAQKSVLKAAPQLADVGTLAADQADSWRLMLGNQFDAWHDMVGGTAMGNAKQISKITSRNASKWLAAWAATLATAAALADKQLYGWRGTVNNQLDDWRYAVNRSLKGNSKSLSRTLSRSAKQVKRAPGHMVTRAKLRMRWMRRGMFFGAIGGAILGLLFAPAPGNQLRTQIRAWFQQMGGQVQTTMTNAQANLPQRTTTTTGTTKTGRPTSATLTETGPIR